LSKNLGFFQPRVIVENKVVGLYGGDADWLIHWLMRQTVTLEPRQ